MPLGTTFSVFGWGHNHRGQLGGVEGNKIKSPKLCESFSELNPTSISGGEQTLFAVTQDGKVHVYIEKIFHVKKSIYSYKPIT